VEGVEQVAVHIPTKQVSVIYDDDKVSIDRLKDVLQEEDYRVESVAAS
jgi:copper chaperone CopZ